MVWLGWSTENTHNFFLLSLPLYMGVSHDAPKIIAVVTSKIADHHKNIMVIKSEIL